MNINATSGINFKKFQYKAANSRHATRPMMADSVSFTGGGRYLNDDDEYIQIKSSNGKYLKGEDEYRPTQPNRLGTLLAGFTILAGAMIPKNSSPFALQAYAEEYSDHVFNFDNMEVGDPALVIPAASDVEKLHQNRDFQLQQLSDRPSLTFDFTNNHRIVKYEPFASSIILTKHPSTIDEYKDLAKAIKDMYKDADMDDFATSALFMEATLKANPDLLMHVLGGQVDYSTGDVANIDPEHMMSTDYTANLDEPLRVYLPTVNVFEEGGARTASTVTLSTSFSPVDADTYGNTVFEFKDDNFKNAYSTEDRIAIIENQLATQYGIPTFDSYAGDAIWHAIAISKDNYKIFKGASEEDTKRALADYISENSGALLVLPSVGVTVIEDKGKVTTAQDTKAMLTQEKEKEVTIGYITPVAAVYDLSDSETGTFRPIDVIGSFILPSGITMKEAYEERKGAYEGLAISAYRQLVDNNDALQSYYADNEIIDADALYEELNLAEITGGGNKINLQPYAIVMSKVQAPRQQQPENPTNPTDPSEPSKPSDPSEPSKPSDPTDPSDPSKPSDPTCPDEPDIDKPDHNLDPTEPSLKPNPGESSEPTTPSQPTDPSYCPTEPDQPTTDHEKNDVADQEVPLPGEEEPEETKPQETEPEETQPEETKPQETQPTHGSEEDKGDAEDSGAELPSITDDPFCPTEPDQPGTNHDGSDASDDIVELFGSDGGETSEAVLEDILSEAAESTEETTGATEEATQWFEATESTEETTGATEETESAYQPQPSEEITAASGSNEIPFYQSYDKTEAVDDEVVFEF